MTSDSEPDIDPSTPNSARMYDYYLGGSHNFEADRLAADRAKELVPGAVEMARTNRDFLGRAVRYCQSQGVDQFLDLGSGIPTVGNVHEIAHSTDPSARVAYVDYEPVAVATCRSLLADEPLTTITCADLRDVDAVLSAPGVTELLDFSRPIGLLTVSVLHFVPDSDCPAELLARYRARLAPGSFHALSHFAADVSTESTQGAISSYRATSNPIHPRTFAQVRELLGDTELVEPGIVGLAAWRPDDAGAPAAPSPAYAVVGRTGT